MADDVRRTGKVDPEDRRRWEEFRRKYNWAEEPFGPDDID
jgi:hypothetical protein